MNDLDQIFTPPPLVRQMIEAASVLLPTTIGDFAAGDGGLLSGAQAMWPESTLIANDIDGCVGRRLRRRYEHWVISNIDFLDRRSMLRSKMRPYIGRMSLVLLNPPYSYRGAQVWQTVIGDTKLSCSQSLAFLANSLHMLDDYGEVIALLPYGCLTASKDVEAWRAIKARHSVDVLKRYARDTFTGVFPRTALVRIRRESPVLCLGAHVAASRNASENRDGMHVGLVRGWLPMHKVRVHRQGYPLIHTTSLGCVNLLEGTPHVSGNYIVSGPGVLIPRVGEPRSAQLRLLPSNQRVVLSDCVFAILTRSIRDAHVLRARLREAWPTIDASFAGTCARYTTIERLVEILAHCGVGSIETVKPRDAENIRIALRRHSRRNPIIASKEL